MKTPVRLLIVTGDDFGLHPEINRGIVAAHQHGLLSHASVMADGPALSDALDRAREIPTLRLGIHLTIPSFAERHHVRFDRFLRSAVTGAIDYEEIRQEWREQIRTLKARGVIIGHMDSHQHVHAWPPLFAIAATLARDEAIPRIRVPLSSWTPGPRLAGRVALNACLTFGRNAEGLGSSVRPHFHGFEESGRMTPGRLARLISRLRPGVSEVMCHPGADNRAIRAALGVSYDWEGELRALTSDVVRARARALDVVIDRSGP